MESLAKASRYRWGNPEQSHLMKQEKRKNKRPDANQRPYRLKARRYFEQRYIEFNGRAIDLDNPRLFSEKVVRRIIYDRNPQYREYCDKLRCRELISRKLGTCYVPQTIGICKSIEELEKLRLPQKWFLKASHGSGWFRYIDEDKQPLNADALKEAGEWLRTSYFHTNREWGYKGLARRLMAEKVIEGQEGKHPIEAHFYVFTGRLAMCRLLRHNKSRLNTSMRAQTEAKVDSCYLDSNYRLLPIHKPTSTFNYDETLRNEAADQLSEAERLAVRLAEDIDFLRIDGILSDAGIVFNELTPYPGAGFGYNFLPEWDAWLGSFWK